MSAGRLWDILNELAWAGDIPVDKATPPPNNKRERGADSPASNGSSPTLSQTPMNPDGSRLIAGRRSLGSVQGTGVAKAPSPAASSLAARAGGLPYDTEYLARANLELVAGMPATNNNMELPWLSASQPQAQASSSSVLGGGQQPIFAPNASTSTNAMPNLNIFDLFQTEPQLFNMPTMEQGYVPNMSTSAGPSADATPPYGGRLPENFGQMDGSMPPVNEALQMWSSAPTSFE